MNKRPPATTGKTVYDIRRENLIRLTAGEGKKTQLAVRLGVSQARISHMLKTGVGSRRITTDQARDIEQALNLAHQELDHDPDTGPMPSAGGASLNMKLFQDVVFAITSTQSEMRVELQPEQVAKIARMAYTRPNPDGSVDLQFVRDTISLAKRP